MATLKRQKSQHLDKIAELRHAVADERRELRELEARRQEAAREVAARREALIVARARGESGEAERQALEEAEGKARGHFDVEIEAQSRRLRAVEGELNRYVAEHLEQIGQERLVKERAARDRLVAALDEVQTAIEDVESEAAEGDQIVREAGGVPREDGAPMLGLDRFKTALRDQREAGVRLSSARAWSPERQDATITLHPSIPEGAGFVDAA
jgi:hypothetical protein